MTIARATYEDLLLTFTPGASTTPSSTYLANLITKLYKDAYAALGETYAANDADAEHAIIDTELVKMIIVNRASEIGQNLADRRVGESHSAVKLCFTEDELQQISRLVPPTLRFASREDLQPTSVGDGYDYT